MTSEPKGLVRKRGVMEGAWKRMSVSQAAGIDRRSVLALHAVKIRPKKDRAPLIECWPLKMEGGVSPNNDTLA